MSEGDEIVRLTTTDTALQAHVLCDALQEEGVRCRAVGDYIETGGLAHLPSTPAEVWVHRDDLEKAQAILAAHRHKEGPEDEED
jgi:hypothetical protein